MAPHSSTLAWKIPWMEESGRLQSMGLLGVGHDWATSLSLFTFMHWRRKWQPTPVFLPGESQGWGSLVGLLSMGSHRVGHDWSDLAAAAASLEKDVSVVTPTGSYAWQLREHHLGTFPVVLMKQMPKAILFSIYLCCLKPSPRGLALETKAMGLCSTSVSPYLTLGVMNMTIDTWPGTAICKVFKVQ